MIINTIPVGAYEANCYLLMDENNKEIAIIDPGGDAASIEKQITNLSGKPKYILLTHGHFDHVGAVEFLADKYKIPFYISEKDEKLMESDNSVFGNIRKADGYIKEGDKINLGDLEIKVLETPGHSKGGLCFVAQDNVFTGDTLFQGSIGRTDFVSGSLEEILASIKNKLLPLGSDVKVYPGHGPSSTIGYEERNNPFLD
ncbi:MAG: MBL fold metallo-hydrolase [Clostridiales bacterium]|mgnify:CR=1 FL=1|nr:MBL fold metallo-hydrolase [Clostridiales bacterium]